MAGFSSVPQFLARLILGIIFIAHGWQKLHTNGMDSTKAFFKGLDVPFPEFSAYAVTWLELVGGILLIIGLLLPLVSVLLIIDMIGAIYYVHWDNGFWAGGDKVGWEWPLALIAGLLAVGFSGGLGAADTHLWARRRRRREPVA